MERRDERMMPLDLHDPATVRFHVEAIDAADALSDDPVARHAPLERVGDGTTVGLRDFSAGRFLRHYDSDEVLHVVEGSASVVDADHRVWSLRPGDVVALRQDTTAQWDVPEYLRVLAIATPARRRPLARRLLQALGNASVAVAALTLIGVTTVATVAASMLGG